MVAPYDMTFSGQIFWFPVTVLRTMQGLFFPSITR